MYIHPKRFFIRPLTVVCSLLLSACSTESNDDNKTPIEITPSEELAQLLDTPTIGGHEALMMPLSDDFANIPQDPNNVITEEKVLLGQFLYHETALSTKGVNSGLTGTWSCASCHHADAGFKSGIAQGIAEGGSGFGIIGEGRVFSEGFDKDADDPSLVPDVQPLTSPAVLNVAYQDVMLWNGQFGNAIGGINASVDDDKLMTEGTPKVENARGLSGIETQAIAGMNVHRLKTWGDSVLQTNDEYVFLFEQAYPKGSEDVIGDAGKAIAAFERTILANEAPFQRWLHGDELAMSEDETLGAILFFGKAGCVSCHKGPALSSRVGASADEMFMAVGFNDFDISREDITGSVGDADSKGRGGFTGIESDNYKFKVPQLYNLVDANIFGHGASFDSVREVIEYKNQAEPQNEVSKGNLDMRFMPLNLTEEEIYQLTLFIENGLYDPNLSRYKPDELPTNKCFPVADEQAKIDLNCV